MSLIENEGDWFRLFIGGLMALYTGVTGWIVTLFLGHGHTIANLDKRLAVMEARPHIDPIKYTEALTNMTNAMTAMAQRMTEMQGEISRLTHALQELREELLVPSS